MADPTRANRTPPGRYAWVGRVTARARAVMRVALYGVVVCSVIAFLALRSAWGDVRESALVLGRELSQFEDLLGKSQRLELNGERLWVASALTQQSVTEVLDRFERVCERGNGLADEFRRLPEHVKDDVRDELGEQADEDGSGLGVMRGQTGADGMVACLVEPPEQRGKDTVDKLTEMLETGDLSKAGWLRYAYARKTPSGKTHVITSWTDGAFRFASLVPDDGEDAPGTDAAGAARPAEARRILSASIEGAPHSIRIYESRARSMSVLASYDREMPDLGWQRMPFVHDEDREARAFTREGVELLVFATEGGPGSVISVVQSGHDAQP